MKGSEDLLAPIPSTDEKAQPFGKKGLVIGIGATILLLLSAGVSNRTVGICPDIIMMKGPYFAPERFHSAARFYLNNSPYTTCVTHYQVIEGERPPFLDVLEAEFPGRFYGWTEAQQNPPTVIAGIQHRSIHRYNLAKNLMKVREILPDARWIMSIRTDLSLRKYEHFDSMKDLIQKMPISDVRGRGKQSYRMITNQIGRMNQPHGWCPISDHFMFAHINDMELYWGFNEFWSPLKEFSREVQQRGDTGTMLGFSTLPGHLTAEAEFCQVYLKYLGKEFDYYDLRKLLSERFIVTQDHEFTLDYWNWHLSYDLEDDITLQTLCDAVDTSDTSPADQVQPLNCWNPHNQGYDYFLQTCGKSGKILDCTVNPSKLWGLEYLGVYEGADDFYTRGEWTYEDPNLEAIYQRADEPLPGI